jgi:hypothetical protein
MANLIKLNTSEYPVSEQEFRTRHKDTSFPPVIKYSEWGYEVVFSVPQSDHTKYQYCVEVAPEISVKGTWQQVWEVRDMDQEQKDAVDAAEKKAESDTAEATLKEIDLKSIRSMREWIAKQPDAPVYLTAYEAEAVAEREKLY